MSFGSDNPEAWEEVERKSVVKFLLMNYLEVFNDDPDELDASNDNESEFWLGVMSALQQEHPKAFQALMDAGGYKYTSPYEADYYSSQVDAAYERGQQNYHV